VECRQVGALRHGIEQDAMGLLLGQPRDDAGQRRVRRNR